MMILSGLHILLTYQCVLECDHCFVWGSPWQTGTMTLAQLQEVLDQANGVTTDLKTDKRTETERLTTDSEAEKRTETDGLTTDFKRSTDKRTETNGGMTGSEAEKRRGAGGRTVEWIYYEGGEPFLYYPLLVQGVQRAAALGFKVGVVSNGYWATSLEDAREWLRPMVGLVQDLSISSDRFHWSEQYERLTHFAVQAAEELGIPVGTISIAQATALQAATVSGQLPPGETGVMFRGRAAEKLAPRVQHQPWSTFTACPYEDLREPGRVHLDPLGNLHICQGIVMGNLFERPLAEICADYDAAAHPIIGPLLAHGPAGLVETYGLDLAGDYADACHLCYQARRALRERFPQELRPDQVYGIF